MVIVVYPEKFYGLSKCIISFRFYGDKECTISVGHDFSMNIS
jgi:hypothetical protein